MSSVLPPAVLNFVAGLFAAAGINLLTSAATGPTDALTRMVVLDSTAWILAAAAVTWLAHLEQGIVERVLVKAALGFNESELAGLYRKERAKVAIARRLAAGGAVLTVALSVLLLPGVGPLSS